MMLASTSTSPTRFGRPEYPTVWSAGLLSTGLIPASTASSADPPSLSTCMAASIPTEPFALAMTIIGHTSALLNLAGRRFSHAIDRGLAQDNVRWKLSKQDGECQQESPAH